MVVFKSKKIKSRAAGYAMIIVMMAAALIISIETAIFIYIKNTSDAQNVIKQQELVQDYLDNLRLRFQDDSECSSIFSTVTGIPNPPIPFNNKAYSIKLNVGGTIGNLQAGSTLSPSGIKLQDVTITFPSPANNLPAYKSFSITGWTANQSTVVKYEARISVIPQGIPWNPSKVGNYVTVYVEVPAYPANPPPVGLGGSIFSCHSHDSLAEACEAQGRASFPNKYMAAAGIAANLQSLYRCQPFQNCVYSTDSGNCTLPFVQYQQGPSITNDHVCLWCPFYRGNFKWPNATYP